MRARRHEQDKFFRYCHNLLCRSRSWPTTAEPFLIVKDNALQRCRRYLDRDGKDEHLNKDCWRLALLKETAENKLPGDGLYQKAKHSFCRIFAFSTCRNEGLRLHATRITKNAAMHILALEDRAVVCKFRPQSLDEIVKLRMIAMEVLCFSQRSLHTL